MSQSKSKALKLFVNNEAFEVSESGMTGRELKQLAGVPGDYELFQVRGNETFPVGNEEELRVHEHCHFRAIPAATFGTHVTSTQT
jgi:hypothetical protein